MTKVWAVGDRVRDKFKEPKPGDEAVMGRIETIGPTVVVVKMDDGNLRQQPRATFAALFERVESFE